MNDAKLQAIISLVAFFSVFITVLIIGVKNSK